MPNGRKVSHRSAKMLEQRSRIESVRRAPTWKINRCHRLALIVIVITTTTTIKLTSSHAQEDASTSPAAAQVRNDDDQPAMTATKLTNQAQIEKQAFVVELLKTLHEQYGLNRQSPDASQVLQERQSGPATILRMPQLLEAIGAEGDMRRLIDWVRNSFNPASIPEVTTQFVVSKLGSVNCPALLQPDKEETLIPRFLLFNEHYVDVPFELNINPTMNDCIVNGKFDPTRKTVILIHGYLGGYTLIDGLTNVKNRLLDLNRFASERAINTFIRTSQTANSSYVFTDDLNMKIRSQLYNVIIVDWFNGANPTPRANYIRAAVNAQVVGKLIARFLSSLIVHCGTKADNLQIVAHSLGCHVSGFTGKAMNAAGHRLGKITHLDPVGLCFGRLFSQPRFRLSPNDALDTQAVHVSLNVFDNPLDGAHSNFLVNGGRDQPGCGNQNEVTNSTTSSVSLLFDPAARFAPCSHLRAFALFEDDHSTEPGQCQFVGYRCQSYDRFLAGKCGHCDATNSQCRLMGGLAPLSMQFRTMILAAQPLPSYHYDLAPVVEREHYTTYAWRDLYSGGSSQVSQVSLPLNRTAAIGIKLTTSNLEQNLNVSTTSTISTTSTTTTTTTTARPQKYLRQIKRASSPKPPDDEPATSTTQMYGRPAYFVGGNEIRRRSDRRLAGASEKRERISQALERLRADTRSKWTSLRHTRPHSATAPATTNDEEEPAADEGSGETSAAKEVDDNHLQADELRESHAGSDDEPASDTAEGATTMASAETTPPAATTSSASTTLAPKLPPAAGDKATVAPIPPSGTPAAREPEATRDSSASNRFQEDLEDQVPLGSQAIPAGSLNGPQYFLGTSSLTPFCVNYYQFRILIAESRLQRVISQNGLASNRLKPQYNELSGGLMRAAARMPQRVAAASGRDMLHLTVKLTDSFGHFFKGFSVLESVRSLARVMNEFAAPAPPPLPLAAGNSHAAAAAAAAASAGLNEPMAEITMLLNSTRPQATKISETILSYYFHPIVLADRVEVNYMSNISPEIRARYSSVLCPVAINDRHQLVKYIECHKVSPRNAGGGGVSGVSKKKR